MIDELLGFTDKDFFNISSEDHIVVKNISKKDVAIIGMYVKVGEATNTREFWELITNGKSFIREFPEYRYNNNVDYLIRKGLNPNSIKYFNGAFLDDIDKFDYDYFSLSPKEAALLDPNQRIFLETAWSAIEDAGYGGKKLVGSRTGVFVGYSSDSGEEYKNYIKIVAPSQEGLSFVGNIKSIIGSRISYLLDLKGPSVMVDTACSSSLVAVHLACRSIRNGECDLAIAGGVKIYLLPMKIDSQMGIGIGASDGIAKTFDDSADGTGGGEGAVAILLKPLSKAIEDKDNIYAVIKGSAINQDGNTVGITAPSPIAQEDVIIKAWEDASIDPETITYIEAHGTGTKLGDPIEINGIKMAFRNFTNKKQFCAVGSIKTNIGHLDNAAGIAGLAKAILALKHKEIPPSIHFKKPNKNISFEDSPVYVNDKLRNWDSDKYPRRCGVSSFGLSGTNCHIILEEGPYIEEIAQENEKCSCIFTLSAKNLIAIKVLISEYISFLDKYPDINISDICYTSNTGRGHYSNRIAILVKSLIDLKDKLKLLNDLDFNFTERYEDGVFFGTHKVVSENKKVRRRNELIEDEKRELSNEANSIIKDLTHVVGISTEVLLSKMCSLYICGADIDWDKLYINRTRV